MAGAAGGLGSLGTEYTHLPVPVADSGSWVPAVNSLGMVPMGMNRQPLVSESICMPGYEPGLGIVGPIRAMMPGMSLAPPPPVPPELPVVKEIIHCESCTLFPQNPNLPPPSTRERPPGCKTVFVGGLPENTSEEVIREVFDRCGDIIAVRKSKKNFCHIRFSEEFMVDKAMYLSGYRMRLGSSADKRDSGRLHVDFAQARDDLYEWQCQQRLLARQHRHIQDQLLHPPSPPIMQYSEHEAGLLAERLKDDSQFGTALVVLLAWLDRGEVSRRSANLFYSMIQSANGHVRRLLSERLRHEEEVELAKDRFNNAMLAILAQFEQITAVFNASAKQKAWDHFSKAQRRSIDMWRKQCEELRDAHTEEIMGIRREEEMVMSNDEDDDDSGESIRKRSRVDDSALVLQACSLREENGSLRWQLEACRTEMELMKQGRVCRPEENHSPEPSLHLLQQSLHSMKQQLQRLQEELRRREQELELAREESHSLQVELLELKKKGLNGYSAVLRGDEEGRVQFPGPLQSEKEAVLLGIISIFLHVHPFGANIQYLWSYIQRLDTQVSVGELERLMAALPRVFRPELSGVGATLEKRWKFCGFEGLQSA